VRPAAVLLFLACIAAVIVAFTVQLPSGTNAGSLAVRAAVAAGIGIVLIVVVRRMLWTLGEAPPTPPAKVDARPADVVYECPTCGTRLRLEVAATGKAPRHCGEEMEAKIS
jgi:hypothetical protein